MDVEVIKLTAKSFRKMADHSHPNYPLRESKLEPLILIKHNGEVSYGKKPEDKDYLVSQYIEGEDILLFPWIGKFSTDVFILDNEALAKYYR